MPDRPHWRIAGPSSARPAADLLRYTRVRGAHVATVRRLLRIGPWSLCLMRYRRGRADPPCRRLCPPCTNDTPALRGAPMTTDPITFTVTLHPIEGDDPPLTADRARELIGDILREEMADWITMAVITLGRQAGGRPAMEVERDGLCERDEARARVAKLEQQLAEGQDDADALQRLDTWLNAHLAASRHTGEPAVDAATRILGALLRDRSRDIHLAETRSRRIAELVNERDRAYMDLLCRDDVISNLRGQVELLDQRVRAAEAEHDHTRRRTHTRTAEAIATALEQRASEIANGPFGELAAAEPWRQAADTARDYAGGVPDTPPHAAAAATPHRDRPATPRQRLRTARHDPGADPPLTAHTEWLAAVTPPGHVDDLYEWGPDLDSAIAGLDDPTVAAALRLAANGGIAVLDARSSPLVALSHSGGDEGWIVVASGPADTNALDDHEPVQLHDGQHVAERLTSLGDMEVETHVSPQWTVFITSHA